MQPSQLREETMRRFAGWTLVPNEHLPLLESACDLRPKKASQVASRAIAAGCVAYFCFGASRSRVRDELQRFALHQHLSSDERDLVDAADASTEGTHVHAGLVESIQFLAWSLGLVTLDHFTQCHPTLASQFPRAGSDPAEFIARARLRSLQEILQEADTLYMLHWRAVQDNLTGRRDPRLVLPRVSFRRHAADWVIGVADAWEDVPLDT
jgi:hypothetical protein